MLFGAGCGAGRPGRISPPSLDPAAVVAKAGDPDSLPSVAAGRAALDGDKDGRVSGAELAQWLTLVRDSQVAVTSLALRVTHLGKPLHDVEVHLVPEACMAGAIAEAVGRTNASGACVATIPGGTAPGVHCGLYRVSIVGRGNDGRDLPAKFNTATTLGMAVGGRLPENGMATFALE